MLVRTVGCVPTAAQYEQLARRFESHAVQVTNAVVTVVDALPPGIAVGPLDTTLQSTVQASSSNAVTLAREFRRLAATCRSRAGVCRRYTEAIREYRVALIEPGASISASPPAKPAPWAEAG